MSSILIVVFLAMLGFLSTMFVYAKRLNRYDLVDSCWGPVFVVGAVLAWVLGGQTGSFNAATLATLLVSVWGLRLAYHIGKRFVGSENEDARYTELRKKWRGSAALNAYIRIYMTQAILAFVILLPVTLISVQPEYGVGGLALLAAGIWTVGFVIEVLADKQLTDFVATNKGKKSLVMDRGLWKYSRHPNYFGELLQWWALGLLGFVGVYGWVGLIGPALLSVLIVFVSGIPPAERRAKRREGWSEYKRKTSVLIPLPPQS